MDCLRPDSLLTAARTERTLSSDFGLDLVSERQSAALGFVMAASGNNPTLAHSADDTDAA